MSINKKRLPTHKTVMINDVKCTAFCEQITCIRKIDLSKYIRSLTKEEFKEIEDGIKVQLALNDKKVAKNAEKTQKNQEQSKYLFSMFDEIWNDKSKVEDITETIVEMIGSAYQENAPEFIYYVILYNIFTEFLNDITEDNMPNEATGFKDTKILNMLYDFQKDGVISIINKLEKHNGCILADSVGLGKTFTALAVIAYYSLRNKSILVLCPKRLSDNWTQYCGNNNDTTNIFYEDRIQYEVLYHTDLGRIGTAHNGRDLRLVNWGNYDLVVIDESHNFRNNNYFFTF